MQIKTLLATELSGEWNAQLEGNEETSRIFQTSYQVAFREALSRFRGEYLRPDDPTALVFGHPAGAVGFALAHQRSLRDLAKELRLDISLKAGLHGVERAKGSNTEAFLEPIAMGLKSLALRDQTLLTGQVFEKVISESKGGDLPDEVVWLEHGEMLVEGVSSPVRVIEVGIPGLSPLKPPQESERFKRHSSATLGQTLGQTLGAGLGTRTVQATQKVHTQRLERADSSSRKYGEYEVIRELGRGGFGKVYLAENPLSPGMKFALKVFNESSKEGEQTSSLLSDLRPMLMLAHPHIVKVCGFGSSKIQGQIQVWMAMTYIEGPSGDSFDLKKYLKSKGKLPPAEVKRVFSEILSALVHVHESFYAHLDLKPQNVLLNKSYRAFLADFGISKSVSEDSLKAEDVQRIEALSPEYASPEQLFERTGTRHSDVFSAGVMILECLTGKRPKELIEIIRYGNETKVEFKLPSSFGVDAAWDKLISRCLKPNPVDRYKDAGALLEALRGIKVGEEKRLALSTSGVLLAAILLGGGYYLYRGTTPPRIPPAPPPRVETPGAGNGGSSAQSAINLPEVLGSVAGGTPELVRPVEPAPIEAPLAPVPETPSATPSWTPEPTATNSPTPTPTDTPTPPPPTPTDAPTEEPSLTPSPTETASWTPLPTDTATWTATPTDTASLTPTQTDTPSQTPSDTPSATATPLPTDTPSATPSHTPVAPMVPVSPPAPVPAPPPPAPDPQAEARALEWAKSMAESFFSDLNAGRTPKVYASTSQDQNLSLNRLLRQTKNSQGEPQTLTVREVKITEYGSIRVGFSKDPAEGRRRARISGKPTLEWCELFVRESAQGGGHVVFRVTLD